MAKPSSAKPEESFGSNSNTQIRQHNIFTKHYGKLTTLLFQANLTPHLIAEGVLVPADEEEINFASSSAKKAQIVLLKIAGSLDARLPEPFYKLITVMKSHGNNALKQLATVIENEIVDSSTADDAKTSQEKPKPEQLDISHPSIEFGTLIAEIAEILQEEVKSNLKRLTTVCYSITSKGNSLLFNSAEIAKIKACESVHDLFYELRGHWRYDDHPLLYAIVKQSGSKKAMGKLEMYRSKIKYHQKVQNIYDHSVSSKTPLPDGYTRMVAIVEKNYNEITKKEYEEIETMLLGNFGGPALRPPTFWPTHSTKIVWYIPTEAVGSVLKMAYHATEMFPLLSISFFEVDGVIIWNKKWPTLQELKQDNESKTVALSTKEETVTSLKTAIEKLESENQQLQKQLQPEPKTPKEETKDAQSTASKSQSLHAIKSERDSLRRDVSQMELTMKKLKNQLEATEKELKDQKDEVTTSKASDDSKAVQDLNEKNSSLTKQLDQLHQNNLHLQDKNSSLQEQCEKKLEEMSTEVEALRIENLKLKKPVSKDHGYHTEELDRLNEKPSGDDKSFDLQQDNKSKGDALSAKEREVNMLTATVDQLDSENKELQRQVSQLKEDLEKQSQSFTPTANENDTPIDEDHGYHLREIDRLREKPSVDDKPFDSGFDSVPTGESAGSEDTDKPLVPKRTDASRDFDKSLVKKLKEKDEKLKEKDDQVTKLQFELSKLKMERITAKQPPSDLQTKNDQLTNEVEQLTEQITQLRSNQTSLSTENKDLQKQNEDLQEMLQQLKSGKSKLEEEQAKEEDAVQDVNKNMAIFQLEQSLHGDAESFTNILNEKEDQISKLQSEMSKLKSEQVKDPKQVAQPSKDFANLQRRNDELANEVRKLTIQVTSLSGNKTSLSTENRSLQQQTKRLEETVTQLKADISKLEDDNMQQAKKFEESDAEVSVLKTENQELRKSVFTDTTASQKIAELEQSLQEQADSFTNIVKEKEDEISKVQLEISKLKSEKIVDTKSVQPSKDIAALQRRNDELANEVGKLTKQITTISSGKTSLSTENRSLQERNKSLEATVTQLEDEKLLHAKRSKEMDVEMRDLKTEIQKLQKSASSVDTTASQKIFELEQSLQEQENSFTNIVKEKEDEISKLQSENSKLKSEKVQDVQVAKPPKENAKLQRKNNELATEVEQLTKQVSQLRGSKTTLSNENRDLQQTVVQLKADNSKLEKEKHQESEKLNQQINALQSENRKLAQKKIVSEDQGYHSKEVATLPEKPPISAKPTLMMTGTLQDSSKNITQAEMDKSLQQQAESYTNVLDEKESTINKLQSEIRTLKTQKEKDAKCISQQTNDTATLRQKNSELTSENDSLNREVSLLHSDIATLKQKSEDAKKLQDEIERLKVEIQKSVSTTSDVRQKNSKLTSDFTALQKQKSEEAKKFQDEIDRLRRENQKLRNPVSADQGFFGSNELDTLPQEPVTTEQQLWKRVKEAESTVDALKQELHDQQDSYEGLMNENEETIQKLQQKLKEAGETKTKEEQEESKSYASLDFQQIMANRRQATEKEDTQ
ncbi:putative leucine-rich repeat-containing protein DDB_G0290503 isoform X3 [Dysidea avara]|uniref:putative leucine-rich repeat-containing protein DDB_G0290503 isoform X3 n=1 Tax=Dysidea avara TaxID=196820 RepID=UPI0033239838